MKVGIFKNTYSVKLVLRFQNSGVVFVSPLGLRDINFDNPEEEDKIESSMYSSFLSFVLNRGRNIF